MAAILIILPTLSIASLAIGTAVTSRPSATRSGFRCVLGLLLSYNYGAFWMADFVLKLLGGDHFVTRALLGGLLDTKHLFRGAACIPAVGPGPHADHPGLLRPIGQRRSFPGLGRPTPWCLSTVALPRQSDRHASKAACHYASSPGRFINVGIYGRPRDFPFDAEMLNRELVDLLVERRARPCCMPRYGTTKRNSRQCLTKVCGQEMRCAGNTAVPRLLRPVRQGRPVGAGAGEAPSACDWLGTAGAAQSCHGHPEIQGRLVCCAMICIFRAAVHSFNHKV